MSGHDSRPDETPTVAMDTVVTPEQRAAGVRRMVRANIASVVLDVALPLALYYGLRAAGVDQWWALIIGIVATVPRAVHQIVSRRELDLLALFTISVLLLSLVVGLLSEDPRALVVREGWAGMVLGLFGLWMVITVIVGRPALLVLGRTLAVTKTGEAGARAWEGRWIRDGGFRRGMRVLTAVWGLVFFLDAVLGVVLTYVLPIDIVPVANLQFYVVLAALLAFHVGYTKKAGLRA